MNPRVFARSSITRRSPLRLENGSRVAVIGGGPAGSLFSYFLLSLAERASLDLKVDIYEPRDFSLQAPKGCNMCGGVISETLVQNLASEGITLPASVVQTAVSSYVLHTDSGDQRIDAAVHEKRIGTVFRGAGPQGAQELDLRSFDGHLLSMARSKGASLVRQRVTGVERVDGFPCVTTHLRTRERYDLLVVATGVNTSTLNLFEQVDPSYKSPDTTKTAIREYLLDKDTIQDIFGDSLHVFLLDIPRLDFAMIVPKGDYVSVCMLGKDIDDALIQDFLTSAEVKRCFPDGWQWDRPACRCSPRINVGAAIQPYADRMVFIGDSGVTRLYKDGLGAAYRAAKAAASCAVLEGVSSRDFKRYFDPFCRKMELDNQYGRIIFLITHLIQRLRFSRKALIHMVTAEQKAPGKSQRMSSVLWDTFTGSAPYRDVFMRTLHPAFISRFVWMLLGSLAGG